MSHLRKLRSWTHDLFDQYGWLILANYSRNTRQVREYTRSVQALEVALSEYYTYVHSRRANSAPLKKLITQVGLLRRRIDRNYGNRNRNRIRIRNRYRNRYEDYINSVN